MIGLFGVLILSDMRALGRVGRGRLWNRAAGLGLASGVLFAVSAVGYRAATLEIQSADAFLRAIVTLSAVTLSQSLAMGAWLAWRAPGVLARIWAVRRHAIWMGLASVGGSAGWFTAFTLQNAALVFAVGQVSGRELAGIALVTVSVLLLVLAG